jgi:anti-sigma regulatory factor (Ser/Thr protein kinase)
VLHGCRQDATQRVLFKLTLEDGQLVMTVADPGPGFDWKGQRDTSADFADEHGRGLVIFRRYATEFQYNDKGNQVTLRKAVGNEETIS